MRGSGDFEFGLLGRLWEGSVENQHLAGVSGLEFGQRMRRGRLR